MSELISRAAVRISRQDIKSLSSLTVSRGAVAIAAQWAVIALAVAVAEASHLWLVDLAAIVVIATRQHALAVLMHDASHFLISRDKRLNDAVSGVFLSLPIFTSTSRYRAHHLRHHQYLNTEDDPDLENSICAPSRAALLRQLFADLVGVNAITTLTTLSHFGVVGPLLKPAGAAGGLPAEEKRLALAFYAAVALALTVAGGWTTFLLFWMLPLFTVLGPILRFRALAEHAGCPDSHDLNTARSVRASLFERFLLAPCNVNFHLEHHLYPSIPFYNLPALSSLLERNAVFRGNAHISGGYLSGAPSVFDEVSRGEADAPLPAHARADGAAPGRVSALP